MNKNVKKDNSKTMEELFRGYTFYSEKNYEEIWENATIVLDTNILLNLYRYSEKTRKEVINLLKNLKDRIWIPYQVGKEYFNNRDKVIKDSNKELEKLKDLVSQTLTKLISEVKSKEKNYQEIASMESDINKFKETIESKFEKIISDSKEKDNENINLKIEREILSLIGNNIGEEPPEEEYLKMIEEGHRRITNDIPPGYKDKDKKEIYKGKKVNGDYIIFKSFINYAKEKNKPIIFITDDTKEDWFHIVCGEKKGGRKELLHEFYKETNNMLLIYSFEGFANKYNDLNPATKLPDNAINEINEVNIKSYFKHNKSNENYLSFNHIIQQNEEDDDNLEELVEYKNIRFNNYIAGTTSILRAYLSLLEYDEFNERLYKYIKIKSKRIIEHIPKEEYSLRRKLQQIYNTLSYKLLSEDKSVFIDKVKYFIDVLENYYF